MKNGKFKKDVPVREKGAAKEQTEGGVKREDWLNRRGRPKEYSKQKGKVAAACARMRGGRTPKCVEVDR